MNRRQYLKGTALGVGALTVGGIGFTLSTRTATAASFNITGTTISSDDGDVEYLDMTIDPYRAVWDGFDIPVAAVAYRDVIRNPNTGVSHELFDQRGDDQQPIRLENISEKNSSDPGWGGGGEYASEDPGSYTKATGPTTSGFVNATVDWRVLSNDGTGGKSIENPGDTDDFDLDNLTDDSTKTTTLEMVKQVWLYADEDTGRTARNTQNGSTVYRMGNDDGVREKIEVINDFAVDVQNEASTTDTSGSGSTSGA